MYIYSIYIYDLPVTSKRHPSRHVMLYATFNNTSLAIMQGIKLSLQFEFRFCRCHENHCKQYK